MVVRGKKKVNVSLRPGTWVSERLMVSFTEKWKPGIRSRG